MSRISQIKQYISTLSDNIVANDHHNTLSMMTKFKKSIVKDDPNQFLLDCLKSKHDQLTHEIEELQKEKQFL